MQFLMVLNEDDVKAQCLMCFNCDRKRKFIKHSKYLNGRMHIAIINENTRDEICDCCKAPYCIRGLTMHHVLYALLPKEKVYVAIEEWVYEYLKSQMLEVMYILGKLGAKNVKLSLERKTQNDSGVEVSANIAIPNFENEVGVKNNKVSQRGDVIDIESTFEDGASVKYTSLDSFYRDPNIYYLREQQDWRDIINQRLEILVAQVKFTFNVNNNAKVDRTLYGKVKQLGVTLSRSKANVDSFCVTGYATF